MSEPFIAEIRIFAGNFAPRDWAFCDGQLLPISQNSALFSLIGTTYGGDGRTTTALPNLKGRTPMHAGSGPGLTPRQLGQQTGETTADVSLNQMPAHSHSVHGEFFVGQEGPDISGVDAYLESQWWNASPNANYAPIGSQGGSQAHNNMQPYLALNYIIALTGTYPPRS
ncbi:MAG: phage tail protein [Candidatus Promineifilaceae bacterium]